MADSLKARHMLAVDMNDYVMNYASLEWALNGKRKFVAFKWAYSENILQAKMLPAKNLPFYFLEPELGDGFIEGWNIVGKFKQYFKNPAKHVIVDIESLEGTGTLLFGTDPEYPNVALDASLEAYPGQ